MINSPPSSATERTKLQFWRTVGQAYIIWTSNLAEVIRISWLWLLLMTPVLFITSWMLIPILSEVTQAASAGEVLPRPSGFFHLAQLVETLVKLPMLASIAVAWHLLVLRDERITERTYLRLDRVVLGYAALLLLVTLVFTSGQYLNGIFAGRETDTETMGALLISFLGLVLMFTALYVAARLSVILPARALERNDITIGRVWKGTQGNGWKLLWGYFLCAIPIGLISGAGLWLLLMMGESRFVAAAGSVFLTYISFLGALIAVGFLSLAYRHFLEE